MFKPFLFSLFLTASLFGVDPSQVQKEWEQGSYSNFLKENQYLYNFWNREGKFSNVLADRERSHQQLSTRLADTIKMQKESGKMIDQLIRDEIHMLELATEKEPDLKISHIVKNLVEYQKAAIDHRDAVNAYALVEVGACNLVTDPVAFQIHNLMTEYALKDMLVVQNVIEHQISQDKGDELAAVLVLERDKKVREICAQYPRSLTSRLCLEALLVNEKSFVFGFDKHYLNNLLTSMRAPENSVEQSVKDILKAFREKKESLYSTISQK